MLHLVQPLMRISLVKVGKINLRFSISLITILISPSLPSIFIINPLMVLLMLFKMQCLTIISLVLSIKFITSIIVIFYKHPFLKLVPLVTRSLKQFPHMKPCLHSYLTSFNMASFSKLQLLYLILQDVCLTSILKLILISSNIFMRLHLMGSHNLSFLPLLCQFPLNPFQSFIGRSFNLFHKMIGLIQSHCHLCDGCCYFIQCLRKL